MIKEEFESPEKRISFESFKSNVCHRLKELGDINFLLEQLKTGDILKYYNKSWFAESLYLLSLVDYLCRIHEFPLCSDYAGVRRAKLHETLYPASVNAIYLATKDENVFKVSEDECIPEFRNHNIIESDIRNVF